MDTYNLLSWVNLWLLSCSSDLEFEISTPWSRINRKTGRNPVQMYLLFRTFEHAGAGFYSSFNPIMKQPTLKK